MDSLTTKTHGKLRRFWDRIEGRKAGHKGPELFPADDSITTQDVYRYRKQRGVNLGSWFTLERWISNEPFACAQHPAESDYDVARGANAKEILEKHWDTWITEQDWEWLSDHGINTVRIPIGFYHVCGVDPSVLDGTYFSDLKGVYEGAWSRITRAIDSAARHGIGVLIDLHAAAGKQNHDAHSGQTGPMHFFERDNMRRTQHVLWVLARELHSRENVVGLQLLNEPQPHHSLEEWYSSTIDEIRRVAPTLPLYIHDGWDTAKYASFVGRRAESDFVVVDHHLYRCFTSSDQTLSGDEHARALHANMNGELADRANSCRGNFIVGEFSAALNPASLRSGEAGEQDRQRRAFAREELELFERHCSGWFFWTYKKDGWDAGWSLRDTIRAEIMPAWYGTKINPEKLIINDTARRDSAKDKALQGHTSYWGQYKGKYEHWRFEDGFIRGWEDAYAFFSLTVGRSISEIGFKGQWAKRRAAAHAQEKGHSGSIWEFEHGLTQGIEAAKQVLLERYQ